MIESYPTVPGVCSITMTAQPWIVCPNRLFGVRPEGASSLEVSLAQKHGLTSPYGIWQEVSLTTTDASGESSKYRFDYVLSDIRWADWSELDQLAWLSSATRREVRSNFQGQPKVPLPVGAPLVAEVMTASTSGSDTARGTDVASAFLSSLGGNFAQGPGINKRQVWARMASQLVAKSELAGTWGGKTYWLIQSSLWDYITSTTALTPPREQPPQNDVNIVSIASFDEDETANFFSYSLPLASAGSQSGDSIYGILHARFSSTIEELHAAMLKKRPVIRP